MFGFLLLEICWILDNRVKLEIAEHMKNTLKLTTNEHVPVWWNWQTRRTITFNLVVVGQFKRGSALVRL